MLKINVFELTNVLLVIFLFFILTRKRDVATLLMVLFVYGTLHFGFGAIMLAANESASLLIASHNEGGGVLAKLSNFSLLGVVFFFLSARAYHVFWLSKRGDKKIVLYIIVVMGALFWGYILNIRDGDWLQLKNVISLEVMLAFVLIGFLATNDVQTKNVTKFYPGLLGGLLILGVADCIAFYEVFSHKSWAFTLESSGAMVYRASSVLFNPNLFASWASLVYLGCAYGMHSRKEYRRLMLWGMVLASIGIYLSGSRSAGYLLLGVLFISTVLLKERLRWVPLVILPVTMLTIYAGALWLVPSIISSNEGWHEIVLLGVRFAAAPLYLIRYIFSLTDLPLEIVESIEGRFLGEGRDAGWFVLYQDVGWLGLVAVIWASCMLVVWGLRAYVAHSNPSSVYALAILFYCLLNGFVMRFQIFPVWLFIGIALIPCLVFWRQLALPALRIRS